MLLLSTLTQTTTKSFVGINMQLDLLLKMINYQDDFTHSKVI